MAQKVHVTLLDDLTGKPAGEGDTVESVQFAFDGRQYTIDLSGPNRKRLSDFMARYIAVARRVNTGGASHRGGTVNRKGVKPPSAAVKNGAVTDPNAVRAWAARQGMQVADRGRIPEAVAAQFAEAHGKPQ